MRLNLGCGSVPEQGWVNVDLIDQPGVDVAHDLDVFPWPFGDGTADFIKAFDVYEHVDKPLEFMGECWRILEPGGGLYIHTAYWLNRNSYRDPTHKRYLTEESFDYWVPGTFLNERYGAAYARGATFEKIAVEFDGEPPDTDLNIMLRKLEAK